MCNHLKPDRCHHCRICGVCVLKMDHHCPWVNNCISYTNYKAFVLFLFYAFTFCSYIVITSLPYFLEIWKVSFVTSWKFFIKRLVHFPINLLFLLQNSTAAPGSIHILFLFIIATMFFFSIMSIFSYHLYLIGYNRTTLGKIWVTNTAKSGKLWEEKHIIITYFELLFFLNSFRLGNISFNILTLEISYPRCIVLEN